MDQVPLGTRTVFESEPEVLARRIVKAANAGDAAAIQWAAQLVDAPMSIALLDAVVKHSYPVRLEMRLVRKGHRIGWETEYYEVPSPVDHLVQNMPPHLRTKLPNARIPDPYALAVARILSADIEWKIAQCPHPECGKFFLRDDRRQKWCVPTVCGNRARVNAKDAGMTVDAWVTKKSREIRK
jgi:hypothetical protein